MFTFTKTTPIFKRLLLPQNMHRRYLFVRINRFNVANRQSRSSVFFSTTRYLKINLKQFKQITWLLLSFGLLYINFSGRSKGASPPLNESKSDVGISCTIRMITWQTIRFPLVFNGHPSRFCPSKQQLLSSQVPRHFQKPVYQKRKNEFLFFTLCISVKITIFTAFFTDTQIGH